MKLRDWIIVIVLIAADQISKLWISSAMQLNQSIEVIKDFFYITYTTNTGAAWSVGEGLGSLFVVVAIALCGGIVYYLYKHEDTGWFLKLVLLLIVAGGLGNAIDRVRLGYVIDFLNFYIFGYDFPVFNIADCCITLAMFGLIISVMTEKE